MVCFPDAEERPVAERHPLKQGLKLEFGSRHLAVLQVAERHPLKQGLKHEGAVRLYDTWRRRAASTKTRIETREMHSLEGDSRDVAERHPLKQGLKR